MFMPSPMVSLVTIRVSLEEVCTSSFEVLNCWLNLVASCLDDENELPLKVIASFSASRFPLISILLIVIHSLAMSVLWSMVSTKSLYFFRLWTQMRFRMSLFNIGSSGEVGTHMQISSQFRKPSSPLKQTHPKYITSPPCVPIGCTRQEVGSLHSLEATLHSLQQTYIRPSIHTRQSFKWSWYTTYHNCKHLYTSATQHIPGHIIIIYRICIALYNALL